MTQHEYQLSDEEYTRLTNGQDVTVEVDGGGQGVVRIMPPCTVRGHDWKEVELDDVNKCVVRECRRCGVEGRIELGDSDAADHMTRVIK